MTDGLWNTKPKPPVEPVVLAIYITFAPKVIYCFQIRHSAYRYLLTTQGMNARYCRQAHTAQSSY